MIRVVQPGQIGSTDLIFDMHRLRKRVFADYLKWDVRVDAAGLEVDQFDGSNTVYLLALDGAERVIGNIRLLPCSGPTMIGSIWSHHLGGMKMPAHMQSWELSRFAVSSLHPEPVVAAAESRRATAELFIALTEICMQAGIRDVFALHDSRIARVVKRLGCRATEATPTFKVDHYDCRIASFSTDATMAEIIRRTTNISYELGPYILPPLMAAVRQDELAKRQEAA